MAHDFATLRATAPSLFRLDGGGTPGVSAIATALTQLQPDRRTELLRKAVARDHVELELDVLAYEQRPGVRNRKSVRFDPAKIDALAATGAGTPFLRDHDQNSILARAGTVIASRATSTRDAREIRQTIRITEPTAVERALRGLMGGVSIGWNPLGPVRCTACDAEALSTSACMRDMHLPGDVLAGDVVVEWLFTEAELVETSEVNVPAVQRAGVESIRASLANALSIDLPRVIGSSKRAPVPAVAPKPEPRPQVFDAKSGWWRAAPYTPSTSVAFATSDADMWSRIRGTR